MVTKIRRLKLAILILFIVGFAVVMVTNDHTVRLTDASSGGSDPAYTGAPSELTCTDCHTQISGVGQFQITAPSSYTPGVTYQIVVTHTTTDTTRRAWGFQLTALDTTTNSKAGNLVATTLNTAVDNSAPPRQYMNQTTAGKFVNQTLGATWTFDWTAPATSVGPVRFYSAGLQANNANGSNQDRTYTATAFSQLAGPTAAGVPVSGQVLTADGRGISKASITMWDDLGNARRAITNPFGYYRFQDVEVGRTYIFAVASKRYVFTEPSQVLNVDNAYDSLNFVAQP